MGDRERGRPLSSTLGRAWRLALADPVYLQRRLRQRLPSRRSVPSGTVDLSIGDIALTLEMDLDERMRAMYRGDYAPDIVRFLERSLEPGDTFVDVGANIGYVSAVALDLVGQRGRVVAFEPVPEYFRRLVRLRDQNPGYDLTLDDRAVSDTPGAASLDVSDIGNIGWNTMVPDFMPASHHPRRISVQTVRLDGYLVEHGAPTPRAIKIDVEGFELKVLQSMTDLFERSNARPEIVCELNPGAWPKLGMSRSIFEEFLDRTGYRAFDLIDRRARVDVSAPTFEFGEVLLTAR